jgi:uncharacterized protein
MDVTLCLTHACNLRCDYCYAGPKSARRMSWDTARRALDFAFAHTLEQAGQTRRGPECQLGFFGGEPLLEWDLLDKATGHAISEAGRLGIRLKRTLTTNMTLLGEKEAAWLLENRFHVGLSLDGNRAMHDTLRRTAGGGPSHELCARALRFYRGPDANGEVIIVVDPRTVSLLAESVAWLISEDIRRISLNPNFTAAWDRTALEIWDDAYTRIGDSHIASFRQNRAVSINIFDGKIRARINGGYRPCDRCGFGENEIAVSAAGYFYPCERLVGDDTSEELRIGHISGGFYPAARRRILADRGSHVTECATCALRERCVNWCSCVNYASTGFINRVPGIVCHHEKQSIAAADRVGAILFAEKNPAFLHTFYGDVFDGREDGESLRAASRV